jgi:hypothetical protein
VGNLRLASEYPEHLRMASEPQKSVEDFRIASDYLLQQLNVSLRITATSSDILRIASKQPHTITRHSEWHPITQDALRMALHCQNTLRMTLYRPTHFGWQLNGITIQNTPSMAISRSGYTSNDIGSPRIRSEWHCGGAPNTLPITTTQIYIQNDIGLLRIHSEHTRRECCAHIHTLYSHALRRQCARSTSSKYTQGILRTQNYTHL